MPPGHANIACVLAALNLWAVFLGIAAGGLTASVVGLLIAGLLSVVGVETGPGIGLVTGILGGLAAGGWVSGRRSAHSHRFHGMVTGLGLALVLVVTARIGGSPAGSWTVVWLALLSIAIAGFTGWLAGRRKQV